MKYARIIGDEVTDILSPVKGLIPHHSQTFDQYHYGSRTEKTCVSEIISGKGSRITMDNVRSCRKCGIGFKRVGFLSADERVKVHENRKHSVSCGECQDSFISLPHLRYHIETHHDAWCGDCCSFCEK